MNPTQALLSALERDQGGVAVLDERAVIEELERRCDQLLAPRRTQPVVVFLLRDRDGRMALANAPALASWMRGNDVDPDRMAEVDIAADRRQFEAEVGRTVEDWLADWRAGKLLHNGASFARAYWAALLEQR